MLLAAEYILLRRIRASNNDPAQRLKEIRGLFPLAETEQSCTVIFRDFLREDLHVFDSGIRNRGASPEIDLRDAGAGAVAEDVRAEVHAGAEEDVFLS